MYETEIKTLLEVEDVQLQVAPRRDDGRRLGRKTVGTDKVTGNVEANSVTTAALQSNSVTLAKLASGITPSHVVKYAGKITWSGSGATLTSTVSGVVAGDVVMATIQTKPTQAAYLAKATPGTDQIIFELSAANTSNDAVIAYSVLRAAS